MRMKRRPVPVLVLVSCLLLAGAAAAYVSGIAGRSVVRVSRLLPFTLPGMPPCPECNVVLVSLDTLRADALPCYGYFRNTAPNLCGFGLRNNYFTKFFSQTSYTLDSHVSILTGLYPGAHNVRVPYADHLSADIPTLTQVLKGQGYATAYLGVTKDPSLPFNRGLERGFDRLIPVDEYGPEWIRGYESLLPMLDSEKPAFLFLHTYWTHLPYVTGRGQRRYTTKDFPEIPVTWDEYQSTSPAFFRFLVSRLETQRQSGGSAESMLRTGTLISRIRSALARNDTEDAVKAVSGLDPFELSGYHFEWYVHRTDDGNPEKIAYIRSLYDERIHSLDQALAPLFAYVSKSAIKRKTIVIITSDHGEEFKEHGLIDHANNIYATVTHVPLFMAVPGTSNGNVPALGQSVDIFPTVLELLGIRHGDVNGRSLAGLVTGSGGTGGRYSVSEHKANRIRAITDGSVRLYLNYNADGTVRWRELYDLSADPLEQADISASGGTASAVLEQALRDILGPFPPDDAAPKPFPDWINPAQRKRLMERGYF